MCAHWHTQPARSRPEKEAAATTCLQVAAGSLVLGRAESSNWVQTNGQVEIQACFVKSKFFCQLDPLFTFEFPFSLSIRSSRKVDTVALSHSKRTIKNI